MQTLGDLVDKLTIVNLKLWHVQNWVYEVAREKPEKFAGRNGVQQQVQKLAALNLQRNRLIEEIDEMAASGVFPSEKRVKIV